MSAPVHRRGFLLSLAAEAMAPSLHAASQVRAIDRFGPAIVARWSEWLAGQPPASRHAAIADLADLPFPRALEEARLAVRNAAAAAPPSEQADAISLLSAIPRTMQRSLVLDWTTGGRRLPRSCQPDDPAILLGFLPFDVPPYLPGAPLPDSPYLLCELLTTSAVGPVYRATTKDMPNRALAISFCLDASVLPFLRETRPWLDRIVALGREHPSPRLARLVAFDLDHPTPYVVQTYQSGGDLAGLLLSLQDQTGHGPAPEAVCVIVANVAEELALLHAQGVTFAALRPACILGGGDSLRDLPFGPALARQACASPSRTDWQSVLLGPAQLLPSTRIGLLRGETADPYLPSERRTRDRSLPSDDVYALGVIWSMLVTGDFGSLIPSDTVTRHRAVLLRCLGPEGERPRDASELLALLSPKTHGSSDLPTVPANVVSPEEIRAARLANERMLELLRALQVEHRECARQEQEMRGLSGLELLLIALLAGGAVVVPIGFAGEWVAGIGASIPVAVGAVWFLFYRRSVRLRMIRSRLEGLIDAIAGDFPDEAQGWGGKPGLNNPEMVREIVGMVEAEVNPPAIPGM